MKRMTEYMVARSRTTLVLVAGAVAAWAVTIARMRGMDDGPGTDRGGLGFYLGIWVTMTAAMMLPSAAPAAGHVARLARRGPAVPFVAGYLAVWTAYGMLAYGLGIWVAVSPATVPGLTDPGGSPSMQMGPTGA